MGQFVDTDTKRKILKLRAKLELAGLGRNVVQLIAGKLKLPVEIVEAVLNERDR